MINYSDPRVPSGVWDRLVPEPNSGCWIWTGSFNRRDDGEDRPVVYKAGTGQWESAARYVYRHLVRDITSRNLKRHCTLSECCNPHHHSVIEVTPAVLKQRAAMRRYLSKTDPGHRRNRRSAILKNKYSITIEQFEEMLLSQGHSCAICRRVLVVGDRSGGKPCVDHDHETGLVRGILCHCCNAGIGYLKSNEEALLAAARYLRRYREDGSPVLPTSERQFRCTKCNAQGHNARTCDRRRAPTNLTSSP